MKDIILFLLYFFNGFSYLVAIGMWAAAPETKTFNYSITIFSLGLTSLLFLSGKKSLAKKEDFKARRYAYAAINFFLVCPILAFVNYLSFKNPAQFDLSKGRVNSLTNDSDTILKSFKKPLHITIFARRDKRGAIAALIELYRLKSKVIKIDVIDPDIHPDKIQVSRIKKTPAVKFQYEKRIDVTYEHSELAYTISIIKVTRGRDPLIYYISDHGELDLSSSEGEGGSAIREAIKAGLFDLKSVKLSTLGEVPAEVNCLVVWGPQTSLSPKEVEVIENFLKKGGSLLIALDPGIIQDKQSGLRQLLRSRGIKVPSGLVIDKVSHVSGSKGSVPLISTFSKKHQIAKEFTESVFFPVVSTVDGNNDYGVFEPLAFTSDFPNSWADKTPMEITRGQVIFNDGEDVEGPISVAGAWEEDVGPDVKNTSRIVAFGNSSFVRNSFAQTGGNFRFFMRALDWSADATLIRSFNLPIKIKNPIIITNTQKTLLFYISIVAAPMGLFGVGFGFYRRRKKL